MTRVNPHRNLLDLVWIIRYAGDSDSLLKDIKDRRKI